MRLIMNRKYIFVVLFISLSVFPAYAERYSSGGEAFFVGALQGLFLMFVFWLWRVIKSGKSKQNGPSKNTIKGHVENGLSSQEKIQDIHIETLSPWEKYKLKYPKLAKSVESISDENLDKLTATDIHEKITTLQQMSTKFDCPIPELRNHCIKLFTDQFSNEELPIVIDNLSAKATEECNRESISITNTMPYILRMWIKVYMSSANTTIP